jgi:hypothetical protein
MQTSNTILIYNFPAISAYNLLVHIDGVRAVVTGLSGYTYPACPGGQVERCRITTSTNAGAKPPVAPE